MENENNSLLVDNPNLDEEQKEISLDDNQEQLQDEESTTTQDNNQESDTKTEINGENIKKETLEENSDKIEKSPEASLETPSESIDIKTENANTTNCLALTIQEDHKLVALKNVLLRSIRMSWKVAVSTITLALLKLFS